MLKICMFKTFLKFAFAFALLYWLISSGKLDLSLVKKSFEIGPQWFFALCLITTQAWAGTFRYKLLLETKIHTKLGFFSILKLNYIGFFFSSVLPGAVTGDLIKMVYIKKLEPSISKTSLLTLTLLDRVLGLTGLLFLTGIFSLLNYSELTKLSPKITHLINLNLLLFVGSMGFFILLLSHEKIQNLIVGIVKKIPLIGSKLASPIEQLFSLRENRMVLLKCLSLSIATQFGTIFAFWIISSPFYSGHVPFQYIFSFIPIGLIATAIPISPGGLGVGHVLFANLFSLIAINNGASLFNLFYLANFAHNILGVIPYLLEGRKQLD